MEAKFKRHPIEAGAVIVDPPTFPPIYGVLTEPPKKKKQSRPMKVTLPLHAPTATKKMTDEAKNPEKNKHERRQPLSTRRVFVTPGWVLVLGRVPAD